MVLQKNENGLGHKTQPLVKLDSFKKSFLSLTIF
jgi:hypothetical protein